jgi:hypothetical protein
MSWPQLIQSPRLWPAGRGITVGSRGMDSFLFGAVLMVALISMGVTTDAAQKRRGLRDYFWPSTSLRQWWSGLCVGPGMQRAPFAGVLLIAAAAQTSCPREGPSAHFLIAESKLASTD